MDSSDLKNGTKETEECYTKNNNSSGSIEHEKSQSSFTNQTKFQKTNLLTRIDNKWIISAKILFFSMALVQYSFYVFRNPFFRDFLGLDETQAGMVGSIMALVSFPCMTIWNALADLTGRHKLGLVFITAASVTCFELFMFVKKGSLLITLCVISGYSSLSSGMIPLLDYEGLRMLEEKPGFSKEMYGRQRLWSTVAYAVITYLSALFMEYRNAKTKDMSTDKGKSSGGYEVLFLVQPISAFIFISALLLFGPRDKPKPFLIKGILKNFSKSKNSKPDVTKTHQAAQNEQPPWIKLLTNPNFLFFLFVVFMNGMARMVMSNFLTYYWLDDYKMSKVQVAYATIFGIAIELIIFFFASTIALIGSYWMLVLAQGSMALRTWLYYLLVPHKNFVWQTYSIELLKGVAFGLTHSASVKIAAQSAPPGLEATAQALYTSMYAQLPAVISAYAGSILYKKFGPKPLFLITASVSSCALIIFIIKYTIEGKIRFWPIKNNQIRITENQKNV